MTEELPVLRTVDELTVQWLERALGAGAIAGLRSEQIGTGRSLG
jgi:hypothetical protein